MNLVKSAWESGVLRFRSKSAGTPIATIGTARLHEYLTVTDIDAQNAAPTAAQIVGGIIVHTSATAGGTFTVPTGTNLDAAVSLAVGEIIKCYVINDGDQIVTVTAAAGCTVADAGQTIAADEAALLIFRKTAANTFVCYTIGA